MELRQLRCFVAAAEQLNFTRAARELGIGQSALSQQIARLEESLGVRLFDRTTRAVRLTAAGREFLPPARGTLRQAEAAEAAARSTDGTVSGRLALGMPAGLTRVDLPALLAGFQALHPEVQLTARALRSEQTLLDLRRGVIDLGLVHLREGAPPAGIGVEPIVTEDLAALVPAVHPLARRRRITVEELAAAMPTVEFVGGFELRALADEVFARAGAERQVAFEVTQGAALAGLVAAGLGTAVVPASIAPVLAGMAHCAVLGLPAGTGRRTYALAWPGEQAAASTARAFLGFVRAQPAL
ncbi:LysR family transcriptional regulator [Kitasatospora sp. NPDC048365]|uniref:LysR family transcriptional regulator n=1 Tax=Kitasatospora sp. NPDC048365 TaxID=3364050 RepID=UPI00372495C7